MKTSLPRSASLGTALSGDVIELRFNGPHEEKPIKLANQRMTIRAGEGYRPMVVFRPTEPDPVKCPRSMLTATGGRLTLINVALQLQVPREVPADNWSLVETHGDQSVRLEKCTLSIQNASEQLGAYHQDVAFFRVKSAPGADAAVVNASPTPTPAATIELVDCIARGEAVLLRARTCSPSGWPGTTACWPPRSGCWQPPATPARRRRARRCKSNSAT